MWSQWRAVRAWQTLPAGRCLNASWLETVEKCSKVLLQSRAASFVSPHFLPSTLYNSEKNCSTKRFSQQKWRNRALKEKASRGYLGGGWSAFPAEKALDLASQRVLLLWSLLMRMPREGFQIMPDLAVLTQTSSSQSSVWPGSISPATRACDTPVVEGRGTNHKEIKKAQG